MLRVSNTGVVVALVLIVSLLVANAVLTYRNTVRLEKDTEVVEHTRDVLGAIHDMRLAVRDAENGQRGYLITGAESYLAPYHEALPRIDAHFDRLAQLLAESQEQLALLPWLQEATSEKLQELAATVALRRDAGFDVARQRVGTNAGLESTGKINSILDTMRQRENALLEQSTEASRRMFQQAITTSLATTAASVFLFAAAVILIRRNIASRVRATEALAEQSEFLRTTLASIVEGIVVTDAHGRITFMNPVAEGMCSVPCASAGGRQIAELFDVREDSDGARAEVALQVALREGRPHRATSARSLFVDGRPARSIEDTAAPLRDGAGRVIGAVLAIRDVTAQRRNERRVAELLEAELQSSERQRRIAAASLTLNSVHTRDAVLEVLRDEARSILDARESFVVQGKTDQSAPESDLSAPLVGRNGRAIGSVRLKGMRHAAAHDAAMLQQLAHVASVALENARLYEELRAGDRRKDEFLATLAHELRNPLAPVRNYVQILRSPRATDADRAAATESIERQVALLVRLVDDLLDVSRISRGKVELRRERVDLGDVVGQALEMSRPFVLASGHSLFVQIPPDGLVLDADPARLAQILSNLLNNAAKYTERGGRIWLACTSTDHEVVISVRDDGIGIQPEIVAHIFDMFWQHEHALERAQGGLGIGLTLVRQLVDLHGGTIEARSEGVGRGSEFVVRLPRQSGRVEKAPPLASPPTLPVERARVLAPKRVLVVDDNHDSAASLAILLRLQGHEVRTAHDGIEALEVEEAFRPHLVLLDIGLPKLHGYDVARMLRERRGAHIAISAMTGFGQPDDRRRSREAGFDHHLVKPVDPKDLVRVLDLAGSTT